MWLTCGGLQLPEFPKLFFSSQREGKRTWKWRSIKVCWNHIDTVDLVPTHDQVFGDEIGGIIIHVTQGDHNSTCPCSWRLSCEQHKQKVVYRDYIRIFKNDKIWLYKIYIFSGLKGSTTKKFENHWFMYSCFLSLLISFAIVTCCFVKTFYDHVKVCSS